MAEEEGRLGYAPAGTGQEVCPVAIAREMEFVAIAQEVDPATRGKAAPICVIQQKPDISQDFQRG